MKYTTYSRRRFLRDAGLSATGMLVMGSGIGACAQDSDEKSETMVRNGILKISLAQWSLNRPLFAGDLDNLGFAAYAKELGFEAIEYVNQFFRDKAEETAYLDQLNARASDAGVEQLLIMVDGEGDLGSTVESERTAAIKNHHKWVTAAKHLGCHSIRVNAAGKGSASDVQSAVVESLGQLGEFAETHDINVIVENHGGYSSHGQWLAGVMRQVDMDNVGTLPDFGNFCLKRGADGCEQEYDRYAGMVELMPFAKAVSAKANNFDADGEEVIIDYQRMVNIVRDGGYSGWIGVEYEGSMPSDEGILATKKLLERYI